MPDSIDSDGNPAAWVGPACFGSACLILVGFLATIEALWSPLSGLLPWAAIAWVGLTIYALRLRKYAWIVASLVPVLYPGFIYGVLLSECLQGNCL